MKSFINKKKFLKTLGFGVLLVMMCVLTFVCHATVSAQATDTPVPTGTTVNTNSNESTNPDDAYLEGDLGGLTFQFSGDGTGSLSATLQILLILTVISLAPSILIMLTSFTRIIIVLHFLRTALGTQTTPPNQVMIGLALFLTFFIMSPVFARVNTEALQPLSAGEITIEEAFDAGMHPIREFMFDQMEGSEKDLSLFLEIAGIDSIETRDDVPTSVLIPAFILSELRIAFIIGFMIYIPFLVIDMVVSSTLMSMGMMMLPPTTISMPFKILLFILADGWDLVIGNVVKTFYG
ncbi:MAG: flagellar type III secretion system pore protein FliP [Lachnospiraceae bacterium]|nr:flagellar type III secretion system pore protein FliP [Lachnospiraceae bacterium]MCR5768160.1 flagellar type III secretion system pore protein FliP [Lachnospiraceae bacterium]